MPEDYAKDHITLYFSEVNEDGSYDELKPFGEVTEIVNDVDDDMESIIDELSDKDADQKIIDGAFNNMIVEMLIPKYVIKARSDLETTCLGYAMGRVDKRKFKRYLRRYIKAFSKWRKEGGTIC